MEIGLFSQRRAASFASLPTDSSARMPQSDPRWLDVLRTCGEVADALVATDDGDVIGWLPFCERASDIGIALTSQPFLAYGGPVARNDDAEIVRALLHAYREHAIARGAVAVTLGTPPFLNTDVEAVWRDAFQPTFVVENFVQLSSLDTHPIEQIPRDRRASFKRQLVIATEAGFRVDRVMDRAQFDAWRAIYEQRYEELSATPYPAVMHRAIFDALVPAGLAELWCAFIGDTLAGGTLFLVDDRTADYFASAYSSEYRRESPQGLVLDAACRAFMERGIRRLNWESSP
ncbi:MAG TPA: GNAT family N-acetyltransferase, partial [Thermoanaerobaculia bacterium]